MIRVVQRQHGGTLLGLVWDPGITLLDNSSTIRDVSTILTFQSSLLGGLGVVAWRSGLPRSWLNSCSL
jgi:hypothetical protein